MATRLLLVGVVVLFLIAQVLVDDDYVQVSSDVEIQSQVVKGPGNRKLLAIVDCGGLCRARCRLHSRPNLCGRACGTCCMRCKCVPPGTSGNRELCGACYTDMTTHGNRTKCP